MTSSWFFLSTLYYDARSTTPSFSSEWFHKNQWSDRTHQLCFRPDQQGNYSSGPATKSVIAAGEKNQVTVTTIAYSSPMEPKAGVPKMARGIHCCPSYLYYFFCPTCVSILSPIRLYILYIQSITGGTDQTSGGCSLC